ncbi:protein of unknown function [Aminobacter niigataensis]|nr:protein of unknown function [Aminobacter niigataensis]
MQPSISSADRQRARDERRRAVARGAFWQSSVDYVWRGDCKVLNGRSGEIRTPDPLVPNQMRYQTALHSEITFRRRA